MNGLIGFKGIVFVAALAAGALAHGAWVVDAAANKLVDEEAGWGFSIRIANETDITLTGALPDYANKGDLDLCGMPGDYAVVDIGTVLAKTGITSLCEPDRITILRFAAFSNCSTITNITGLGEVVTLEGKDHFYNAKNLAGRITLPKVTQITQYMFNSTKVQEVVAPNATEWLAGAFTSSITNIVYDSEKLVRLLSTPPNAMKGDLAFPNATYVAGFSGASGLTSIDLPKVATLGSAAFMSCTSLTNFTGGTELTVIEGKDVFWNCPKLRGEVTWPKLKVLHGNTFSGTKVTSLDLSSLEMFSAQYANGGWLTGSITNLILGPVTAVPETGMGNNNPAVPQVVHFLGPHMPTFAGKAFDNPDSKICRFYIHNKAALPEWQDASLQLRSKGGAYGKYFYDASDRMVCPKRTIGLVNATGHDPNGWGYAYAINAVPTGFALYTR